MALTAIQGACRGEARIALESSFPEEASQTAAYIVSIVDGLCRVEKTARVHLLRSSNPTPLQSVASIITGGS